MSTIKTHIETKIQSADKSRSKLVPELRFKEFDGDWNFSRILDVASKITDGTHDTPQKIDDGIPYLTALHVKDGNIDVENCYYLSQKDHDVIYKRCNPEFGDLLIVNIGAGTATCASVSVDYQFSLKNVALVKPDKKIIEPDYLTHLQRKKAKRLFHELTSGGAQPFFSLKEIGKIKVEFPSLPEQQKIASFLSAVDEKIQQLTKKKELLEQYKKGVMQQLFSGELRFKDENGNSYPDWEEKRLGEICESIKSGNSRSSDVGEVPLYGSTGIIGNCLECSHQGQFILIARVGANAGTINLIDDNFGVSDNTLVFVCKPILEIRYIYYFLAHYNLNRLIYGSGQPLITGGQLKALKLKLPNIEEQQKIATYLSSIDTKIESVKNQIAQTQTFKKGLLQKMFV